MADGFFNRLLAPKVILPLLLVAVVTIVLMTPVASDLGARTQLTTHSPGAGGARAFYETAERLGWKVERRVEPFSAPLATAAVYAVLAPPMPLSPHEIHVLLSAVREGAGLLLVLAQSGELADSLGIGVRYLSGVRVADSAGVPATMSQVADCGHSVMTEDPYRGQSFANGMRVKKSVLQDTVTLMKFEVRDSVGLAALGGTLGRGRVVVVSDPSFFRNDVLHICNSTGGVVAIRMAEWLGQAGTRNIIFDEHHHGFGEQPSSTRVVRRAMLGSPLGRTVSQWAVAALVLLFAAGMRPIAPRARQRIERRSPLEHVGALSRAYEQIGATKRGTQLLVRGLRRRREAATWKRGSDEEFLRSLASRHPDLSADVDRIISATRVPCTPADFIHVGQAIEHIERKLSSDHS